MASPDIESPWLCAAGESFCGSFSIRVEEGNAADILHVLEVPTSSVPYNCSIPKPPPLPIKPCTKNIIPIDLYIVVLFQRKQRMYGISFSKKEMVQMSILSPRTNLVFKLIRVYWLVN